MRSLFYSFLFCFLFCGSFGYSLEYDVDIQLEQPARNSKDNKLIAQLKSTSATFQLRLSAPPLNAAALKRRAERDIDTLKQTLFSLGYFSCQIKAKTYLSEPKPKVICYISKGRQFRYGEIKIITPELLDDLTQELTTIGLETGNHVQAQVLDDAGRQIITLLRNKGYPLAKIEKRTLIADRERSTLDVSYIVTLGPRCNFGPLQIVGSPSVNPQFYDPHCPWQSNAIYSAEQVEELQSRLEKSGLFKSVMIKEGIPQNNIVPIEIHTEEALPRTIGAGLSYTTTYGPGISAQWAHRNFFNSGEKLAFRADLWEHNRFVTLSYTIPNFGNYRQNLIYLLEYDYTTTISYVSSAVKASVLLESKLATNIDFVRGVEIERLKSDGFDGNHLFRLAKLPMQLKWSSANNLLDPTHGAAINFKLTPAFQAAGNPYPYLIQNSSVALYRSFFEDKLTLATRAQLANIFGESDNVIPLPDRLFGGTENSMRGYKNLSVAPLNRHGIPVGGRSMLTGTLEARIRTSSPLGWVVFYDVGNVYLNWMPDNTKLFQSVGFGVRYNTPIGPMRLDFAVPLNRRPEIDPKFQIYFSIGQAF